MPAPARYFYESPGNTLLSDNYNGELNLIRERMEPSQYPATYINVGEMQTMVDPGEVGSESLATDLTGEFRRLYRILKEITGKTYWYQSPTHQLGNLYPVGTILPFYDFNGTVTFNTTHWAYCDGSTISNANSSLNGQVLPDLSGRYLVGFGTEGGGDIDTATWNVTAVGVANSDTTNTFSHTHTDAGHNHTQTHNHAVGTLKFVTTEQQPTKAIQNDFFTTGGTSISVFGTIGATALASGSGYSNIFDFAAGPGAAQFITTAGTGSVANNTTALDSTVATFADSLTSLDIRPRSLRVRYIMRIV